MEVREGESECVRERRREWERMGECIITRGFKSYSSGGNKTIQEKK